MALLSSPLHQLSLWSCVNIGQQGAIHGAFGLSVCLSVSGWSCSMLSAQHRHPAIFIAPANGRTPTGQVLPQKKKMKKKEMRAHCVECEVLSTRGLWSTAFSYKKKKKKKKSCILLKRENGEMLRTALLSAWHLNGADYMDIRVQVSVFVRSNGISTQQCCKVWLVGCSTTRDKTRYTKVSWAGHKEEAAGGL